MNRESPLECSRTQTASKPLRSKTTRRDASFSQVHRPVSTSYQWLSMTTAPVKLKLCSCLANIQQACSPAFGVTLFVSPLKKKCDLLARNPRMEEGERAAMGKKGHPLLVEFEGEPPPQKREQGGKGLASFGHQSMTGPF